MGNLKIPALYKDIVELAAPELCFLETGQGRIYAKSLGLSSDPAILWTLYAAEESMQQDAGGFLPTGYLHIVYDAALNDYFFMKAVEPQENKSKPTFLLASYVDTNRSYAGISNSQFAEALAALIAGKTIKLTSTKACQSLRVFAWRHGHRVTIDPLEHTAKYAGAVDKIQNKGKIFSIIEDDGSETPFESGPSIGDLL